MTDLAKTLERLLSAYRKPDSTTADAFALRSHMVAHADEIVAALHRTGQLIVAQAGDVEAVARAIESARCPGREGPFGGYDYGHNEAFYGKSPEGGRYVIRDFRDPTSSDWGKWLHQTDDSEAHEVMFAKMTRDHIAQAAIAAMPSLAAKEAEIAALQAELAEAREVPGRIVAWLREDAGWTADELRRLHTRKALTPAMTGNWEAIINTKFGIATAIEARDWSK